MRCISGAKSSAEWGSSEVGLENTNAVLNAAHSGCGHGLQLLLLLQFAATEVALMVTWGNCFCVGLGQ